MGCDLCDEWFHVACISTPQNSAAVQAAQSFACIACCAEAGQEYPFEWACEAIGTQHGEWVAVKAAARAEIKAKKAAKSVGVLPMPLPVHAVAAAAAAAAADGGFSSAGAERKACR